MHPLPIIFPERGATVRIPHFSGIGARNEKSFLIRFDPFAILENKAIRYLNNPIEQKENKERNEKCASKKFYMNRR